MERSDLYREMYRRRFGKDIEFRNKMYQVLCAEFFQKYIPEDATVLEIGAGYCEFINNIKAKNKIALDLNPDVKNFAKDSVEVVIASSMNLKEIENGSIEVAFANNFFEHLSKFYHIQQRVNYPSPYFYLNYILSFHQSIEYLANKHSFVQER